MIVPLPQLVDGAGMGRPRLEGKKLMVTVIVISSGPATGDPEPSIKDLVAAAERLQKFAEELEKQSEELPLEVIAHDWPNPITVCERVRVGRSGPDRVNVVCGRFPSGFK